jgi:hypothetical protein
LATFADPTQFRSRTFCNSLRFFRLPVLDETSDPMDNGANPRREFLGRRSEFGSWTDSGFELLTTGQQLKKRYD